MSGAVHDGVRGQLVRDRSHVIVLESPKPSCGSVHCDGRPQRVQRAAVERLVQGRGPARGGAAARPAASLRGRGLFIVDRLSDTWGTNPPGSASNVWFMITLDSATASADHQSASTEAVPPADR